MRRGYIRLSKAGPSLKEQQDALASAGIDNFTDFGPVYVDVIPRGRPAEALPNRRHAIISLEPGDELVVASAARLGTSAVDVLEALAEIGRRGASVFDVEQSQLVSWHPDALPVLEFASRAEAQGRKEVAAKMRRARVESGMIGGQPAKLKGALLAKARSLWADPRMSAAEVSEEVGVSVRTLYRHLGDKTASGSK
ncbi:recombinase family protein [Paracoccus sp. TOH]|uniref:recombinase family protein n=1 Tax=Paracoccus sp. TOH TaxID=1263728 RepID=UPI0025B053DA|nr:recombinase family protein [Paracoccus sp. TOH]WJS87210.1 recombinase family protein [Paracoccus sp. TOH]